jgi:tetratricopeptide (TPR) repeat protein
MSCSGHQPASPESVLENTNEAFVRGELERSQNEAERGYQRYRDSDPRVAWTFRIVEAKAALWRGLYQKVIDLLSSVPTNPSQPDLAIPTLTLVGVANSYLHNFREAEEKLKDAEGLCSVSEHATCGDVLQARGLLASVQTQSASALQFYRQSLSFARSHSDRFLESSSLLNLGAEALSQGYLDEAIDQSQASYDVAKTLEASVIELVAQGNIGWAYYKLGDSDKALGLFLEAEKRAGELGDLVDQGAWLTDAGYVYLGTHDFELAKASFHRALELEENVNSKEEIYNVQ